MKVISAPAHPLSPALVVEVIGLPGTGKTTTIAALLTSWDGDIAQVGKARLRNVLPLTRGAVTAAAPFLSEARHIRQRRWNKLALMAQVHALAGIIERDRHAGSSVLVLDQGPVYTLGILQRLLSSPPSVNAPAFERFWRASLAFWSQALDLVVYLDASDDVLYDRIRARDKRHRVKELSRDDADARFRRWRESRDQILEHLLIDRKGPRCMDVDTGAASIDDVRLQILDRIGTLRGQERRSVTRQAEPGPVVDESLPR
jgi:hypothetical protein